MHAGCSLFGACSIWTGERLQFGILFSVRRIVLRCARPTTAPTATKETRGSPAPREPAARTTFPKRFQLRKVGSLGTPKEVVVTGDLIQCRAGRAVSACLCQQLRLYVWNSRRAKDIAVLQRCLPSLIFTKIDRLILGQMKMGSNI
jgi:hypothetical protein